MRANEVGIRAEERAQINKIVKIFNAQWVKIDGVRYICKSKSKTEAEIVKEIGRY